GMNHDSIDDFLTAAKPALAKAPGALIFADDAVELRSTLDHALARGFGTVALFADPAIAVPEPLATRVHHVPWNIHHDNAVPAAVNKMIAAAPGAWLHYAYTAEYLFFP